jgi:uncharacterized protein YndB with AHSA1/START domain
MDIHLAAPIDRVWDHLTDRRKLAQWLMESDISANAGARFTFTAPPSGSWDGRIHCEVKEAVRPALLSFTWNANDIGVETLVTFRLEEASGGTRLILTHARFEGAMPGAEGRHAAGWTQALKSLKTALCGSDPDYDWSAFQITFFVEAPVADVFRLWSTAGGLTRFWADEVACTAPDGSARGDSHPFRNGDRIDLVFPTAASTDLEIINIEKDRFVAFRFGQEYGWVRVAFSEEEGRTRIVLRQFGLPSGGDTPWEVHANARGWWIFNLMNLKSVLLHGRDLRVRDAAAASGLGARYRPGGGTAPAPHDWTRFDVYLYVGAPPQEVLSRWQTPRGIESFFVEKARFTDASGRERPVDAPAEAGDAYEWCGLHGFTMRGKLRETAAGRVAFTFGSRYEVEVTAAPHGAGTLLHLRQGGMADDAQDRVDGSLNCRSCWIYFLTALKAQSEGGIDLRDRNPATADSISVGFNR